MDIEIKNIFQDLISYRDFGKHNVRTEKLKEEILKQKNLQKEVVGQSIIILRF